MILNLNSKILDKKIAYDGQAKYWQKYDSLLVNAVHSFFPITDDGTVFNLHWYQKRIFALIEKYGRVAKELI
jgi:hypothetical protein